MQWDLGVNKLIFLFDSIKGNLWINIDEKLPIDKKIKDIKKNGHTYFFFVIQKQKNNKDKAGIA